MTSPYYPPGHLIRKPDFEVQYGKASVIRLLHPVRHHDLETSPYRSFSRSTDLTWN